MNTIADVFIIESLDPDDEGNGRFEGVFLSHVLKLHGKNPKYRYVRTRDQFSKAIREFGKSKYRYLHLSCHGNQKGMCTTNQEKINFDELANLLKPYMTGRRLLVSACKMVHQDLAKALIPASECTSVVGPTTDIAFTDSAVVWASVYHLAFSQDARRITRDDLQVKLKQACKLFGVSFAFYAGSPNTTRGYTKNLLAE